ncbi:MAG: hypothetical protein IJJ85_04470 [Clostridia bacterium]|nr:hypothetical protein [Clostridia bacterium]
MKSDVIHVTSSGEGIALALQQTEAVAAYKSLSKKDGLHLRLLAEEMMGMLRALTGDQEADFWIEDENAAFCLHLKAQVRMNTDLREKLLSASTSGKNAAAKGVSGKIRDLFSRMLEGSGDVDAYASGFTVPGAESMSVSDAAAVAKNAPLTWSFNRYKASAAADPAGKEEWDALEKSVLSNVADEIEISIAGGYVEMIVYKKFE